MDGHEVDRYDVAATVFRFWWIVAALGATIVLWLLRSMVMR